MSSSIVQPHISASQRAIFSKLEAARQDELDRRHSLRSAFLWAEENPKKELPSDLAAIVRRARELGAEYVLFDRDAPLT